MNCIVCAAMIKWVFPFVVPVVGQLRSEWSRRWGSTGMWSTSCAPSARNPSWATGTTRSEDWPTARRTIISSLATYASFATKSLEAMVSKLNQQVNESFFNKIIFLYEQFLLP